MVRNESIDILKGILIILVIIGHILHGSLDDNILRYYIYSFHMPVFFFLSGYLLNIDKLADSTPKSFFSKYWKRMLFQWTVALLVYSLLNTYSEFTIQGLLYQIIHPYYHLWYVPTLFLFVLTLKLFRNIKHDFLFFALLFSLGLLLHSLDVSIAVGEFRLSFFIFFLFGLFLRNYSIQYKNKMIGWVAPLIFSIIIVSLYFYGISFKTYLLHFRLPLIIMLCCTFVISFINNKTFKSKSLSYIGEHSLGIYLWHVVPIFMINKLIPESYSMIYYILTFGLLVAFVIGCGLLKKETRRQ